MLLQRLAAGEEFGAVPRGMLRTRLYGVARLQVMDILY